MIEDLTDLYEDLHQIDRQLEGLQRAGWVDCPRASLLRRRREYTQQCIRDIEALVAYGR